MTYTTKRHAGAQNAVSSVTNYWARNGISFYTKKHPVVGLQLKGYQKIKPSKKRKRNPFTIDFIRIAIQRQIIDLDTFHGALMGASLALGYFNGLRIKEYAIDKQAIAEGSVMLRRRNLTFDLSILKRIIGSVITLDKSKTDQFGTEQHQVSTECTCPGPCGPHLLYNYLTIRKKTLGPIHPEDPLLANDKGNPLKPEYVSNIIKNIITQLDLNPDFYQTHSLRIGACSDMARANIQEFHIQKWGRWKSDCWKNIYNRIDYRDLAKLTHTAVAQWAFNHK